MKYVVNIEIVQNQIGQQKLVQHENSAALTSATSNSVTLNSAI